MRKKCVPKKCSISYDFEVQKYDNSFIKTCNNCIRVQEHLNKIDSLKHRLDLLKFKIKCEEKNLKCLKQIIQKPTPMTFIFQKFDLHNPECLPVTRNKTKLIFSVVCALSMFVFLE